MIIRVLIWSGLAMGWLLLLYGVINVYQLEGDWGHGLCGPWGCGPRLQAIVACHAFWLVLLCGPAGVAMCKAPRRLLRMAAGGITLAATFGLLGIIAWQAATWLPQVEPRHAAWFPQRCLFVVATFVELPLVELCLVGSVLLLLVPRQPRRASGSPFALDETPAAADESSGELPANGEESGSRLDLESS